MKYLRYDNYINGHIFYLQTDLVNTANGKFHVSYISPCLSKSDNNIYDEVPKTKNNNISGSIIGTEQELENWKSYILNNTLPLFVNMCLNINQNNVEKKYVPWIVDKKYNDDEIYSMLGLSPEEQTLIKQTIKKFNSNSCWFNRFKFGKKICKEIQ